MSELRKVRVDDLPNAPNPTTAKKEVDEAVGATAFGFNVYVAEPGEQLPWGFHYHPDHEELLYVADGELRVETAPPDAGTDGSEPSPDDEAGLSVSAGEALFVPPGAAQRAVAVGDEAARVVAVGAPKTRDGSVVREACEACGDVTDREYEEAVEDGTSVYVLYCAGCGAETGTLRP